MATTARWALRYPVGADAADVPLWMNRLALDLDDVAKDDQGTLAARPVSTGGSPGKRGRYYKSTDDNRMWRDHGTGWDEIPMVPVDPDDFDGPTVAEKLGLSQTGLVHSGKSIIAAAETRANAAYGLLGTPDRVQNVVLPTDGVIQVIYHATWKETGADTGSARAAIFVGANQLKVGRKDSAPVTQAAAGWSNGAYRPLTTFTYGLISEDGGTDSSDVTTGQVLGAFIQFPYGTGKTSHEIAGTVLTDTVGAIQPTIPLGGPVYIFAAAGTYDISVQFKTIDGASSTLTAKDRKLFVRARTY